MRERLKALNPQMWEGSCTPTEFTPHQIAPYIGKMKSSMAQALIEACSLAGDTILDPFVGSGTVALEGALSGRPGIAFDVNPYAVLLTRAKLTAPPTVDEALNRATHYLAEAKLVEANVSLRTVPRWVRMFFHPQTLRETLALALLLRHHDEYFLLGCLMGILHHQRPGFLSYPASHLVPYLRTRRFPKSEYPELYRYRAVAPRLLRKIERVYRRFPKGGYMSIWQCEQRNAAEIELERYSIDAVITSPPYMNGLDYVRDNRLRLWFLGATQPELERPEEGHSRQRFLNLMAKTLIRIRKVLKPNGKCVLVLGDIRRSGHTTDTAQLVMKMAVNELGGFRCLHMVEDTIPDMRRSRRENRGTSKEYIIILELRG